VSLVIFDLDGVLCPSRVHHFEALNQAITEVVGSQHVISHEDHLRGLDGIPTREKLARMSFLTDPQRSAIAGRKQELTRLAIASLPPSPALQSVIAQLRDDGHTVAVASNSVRATIDTALTALGLDIPLIFSNEDVELPKPNPAIYLKAMIAAGVGPNETVIVEDSPTGREAAERSGARVIPVLSPDDVTYDVIVGNDRPAPRRWRSDMNVLIPMAGAGSRFAEAGFTFIKPLIEVFGKPMIQSVVENLGIDAHFIFVCQSEHIERYNLRQLLRLIAPGCEVVETDGITEGAACTAMLAQEFIDNNTPLLIANADQHVEWNPTDFYWWAAQTEDDGAILTFNATHPKWSFVDVNEYGYITEVAEKRPISDIATCGIYWWKRGSDFVTAVQQMMDKNDRTNSEFYIAPSFNHAIMDGARIASWKVDNMFGLGTPEDLRVFLDRPCVT